MAGKVAETIPAVRQNLTVAVPQARRERQRDPAAEPDQDWRAAGQRTRAGQRGDGLAAQAKRGGQPAGHQEALHCRRRRAKRPEPPGRRSGLGQVRQRRRT